MTLEWIGATWLPRLFAAGVQSLLMVAAIWLLVRWLRPSAAVRCWLWWCAALQLLLGALWPAPLELPLLPAQWQRVAEAAAAPAAPQLSPGAQLPYLVTRADFATPAAAAPSAGDWLSWPALFAALWLAGLIVLSVASVRGYLSIRRRVAAARDCEHAPALHAYRALGASLGLRRLPPLRVSAQIDSPQLVGPPATVLLPQRQLAQLSDDELAMALHHELTHLRRRDLWWGWVPALARHLFFFHPLAHVIAREYAIAREQACDAAVLDSRRYAAHDYGRLLLRLGVARRPAAGVAGASPTYTVLKRRLTMLQNKSSNAGPTSAAQPASARGSAARLGGAALIAAVAALGLVPYKVTAAAEEAALASVASSSVTINDQSRRGERRITEINDGDTRVWSIKDGQYYRVYPDGREEPVRDAATRAHLDVMQRDAARAEVEAERASREAEAAGREAERAGRQAELDGRRAEAEAERARRDAEQDRAAAMREAEQARRDAGQDHAAAMREAEQARRDAAQAQRDAEQTRRDAGQGQSTRQQAQRDAERARLMAEQARLQADQRQREREQVQRGAEQARRAGEQARREADQRQREREQVQRDAEQARRVGEQARREAAQTRRNAEQAARQRTLDSSQLRRDVEQALRDAQQASRDIDQARRDGLIDAADSARLQAFAGRARLAVRDLDVDAVVREAQAATHAAGPAAREALRAAAQAMREVQRGLADAGS